MYDPFEYLSYLSDPISRDTWMEITRLRTRIEALEAENEEVRTKLAEARRVIEHIAKVHASPSTVIDIADRFLANGYGWNKP